MGVGKRVHLVTLQRPSGKAADGYEDVPPQMWAEFRPFAPFQTREALQFGAPVTTFPWVLVMAYRGDVRSEWRVYEPATGRRFHVGIYVDPDDKRRDLHLMCTELQ